MAVFSQVSTNTGEHFLQWHAHNSTGMPLDLSDSIKDRMTTGMPLLPKITVDWDSVWRKFGSPSDDLLRKIDVEVACWRHAHAKTVPYIE